MVGVQFKDRMKMTTTTTKQMTAGRFGGGGQDSAPIMEYVNNQPNGRMLPVAISMIGTSVRVQTKEGKIYDGILKAFSNNYDLALEVAHQLEIGKEEELPRRSGVVDKLVFKIEDIVKLEGTPDLDSIVKTSGFMTDSEISRANNGVPDPMRKLEAWEPDADMDDDHLPSDDHGLADGWSVDEMFKKNENEFGVQSTYNESLYHTADLNIDPNSEIDQARARRASELAREIERNPASKRNAELENDDEERDIITRNNSSSANSSTATTPTSGAPLNRYIPPGKRQPPDRPNRGGRRGGVPGAPFQPQMRNQAGGDIRGGPNRGGPPRGDFGDPGVHQVPGGYYGQRPGNRFPPQQPQQHQQQQHHSLMAQTSHDRSAPPGPGVPNEWSERNKGQGPKRQDIRGENQNAGSYQQLPPQMPGGPPMTRPLMPPPRPNVEANGNRRNIKKPEEQLEELKKFKDDFQLAPAANIPNMSQRPSIGGSSGMPPPSSASQPRMGPQSSPTQAQYPPMNVPPPPPQPQQSQQQRRSPDLKSQSASNYAIPGGQPPHHQQHAHPKQPIQISPGQAQTAAPPTSHPPPPMMRTDVPPRMPIGNEGIYPSQVQHQQAHSSMQSHPSMDYSNQLHIHQQRPNHPSMMAMQGGQAGTGSGPVPPKMQSIPGHMQQMQQQPPMVLGQPPPPPPSAVATSMGQAAQQQQPPPLHQHQEQEQRHTDSSSESGKKQSNLNPNAPEFCPKQPQPQQQQQQQPQQQQFRPASTAAAPPMVPMMVANPAMGGYPQVQSPPHMSQTPVATSVYGNVPMPNPAAYVGQVSYSQHQPHSSAPVVHMVPQGLYAFPNSVMRQRAPMPGQPQQAVAAATGQPIMATPYQQQQIVMFQSAQQHVLPPGAAYPQTPYYVNANRMMAPQYIAQQASAGNENSQQALYAGQVQYQHQPPTPVPTGMHPAPQYGQQQNNGNNNHSQTPPTSQQSASQPTNQNPAAGPPPMPPQQQQQQQQVQPGTVVSGAGPMNPNPVITYPPSAPTPQSPQYPPAPGAYPPPPYVFVATPQGQYMTATSAGPQYPGVLTSGGMLQNAVPYGYAPQAHYIGPEQFAAAAAAQAAAQQQFANASAYHPAVLRSSSVASYPPNGTPVTHASGPPSVSHQSSHS